MRNGYYAIYHGQEYETGRREEKTRGLVTLFSWDKKDLDNGFYCEKSQEYMERNGFSCLKEVPKSEITEEYRITSYAAYKGFIFHICGSTINNELRLSSQMLSHSQDNKVDREIIDKITEMGFYVGEVDKTGCFYEKLVPIDDPELDTFEVRKEIEINKLIRVLHDRECNKHDIINTHSIRKYAIRGVWEPDLFVKTSSSYVHIYDRTLIEYAEKCARAMNSLSDETIDIICRAMNKYYLWIYPNKYIPCMITSLKQRLKKPATQLSVREILRKSAYLELVIDKPEDDAIGYCLRGYFLNKNVDDISVIIKDNKILYVGNDEGYTYTAWSNFPKDDEYNFVNLI